MTIKGTWADGSPLLAIPNYARLNRGNGPPPVASDQADTGAGGRRGRGGFRGTGSTVWMLDQQPQVNELRPQ